MPDNNDQNTNGKIVCNALDVIDGRLEFREVEIDLQEGPVGLGKPMTKIAADLMIDTFIKEVQANAKNEDYLDQIVGVQFGKEKILYLLSQQGCESLIFYFCKNHKGKHSLAIIPLNNTDEPLPRPASAGGAEETRSAPIQIAGSEVGGGKTIREFLDKNSNRSIGGYNLV